MKTTTHLIFIKPAGKLVLTTTDNESLNSIDQENFYIKTVELDTAIGEYWNGDYHTGKIRNSGEIPLVLESRLKYNANIKALNEYSIHKQVGIIMNVLEKSGIPLTPEFIEMKNFIDAVKLNCKEAIEKYKNSKDVFDFVSEEDDIEHQNEIKKFLT
jgi:hypothetical protein